MKRVNRLQAATRWITTYDGKNIIKGYQNWFGVDFECAVHELRMLKVKIDEQYVSSVLEGMKQELAAKKRKIEKTKEEEKNMMELFDSDDHFYYIAGYTAGGFPYGITWEEYNA